jgi:hypothetical protein
MGVISQVGGIQSGEEGFGGAIGHVHDHGHEQRRDAEFMMPMLADEGWVRCARGHGKWHGIRIETHPLISVCICPKYSRGI